MSRGAVAILALTVVACAGPSAATDEGGSESSTSAETSGDGETGVDSWGGDGDGDPSEACPGQESWPYAGPLCGPVGLPCSVEADLQLGPPQHAGGSPSIAIGAGCRPHLLAAIADHGLFGFYATYDGGWMIEQLPMPVVVGGIVVDPATQIPTVQAYDGAFGLSTWVRDPDWQQVASFEGMLYYEGALMRDVDGLIHVGYRSYERTIHAGSFDGSAWTIAELIGPAESLEAAVSLGARIHVSSWSNESEARELIWQTPQVDPELVVSYPPSSSSSIRHAIITTGGDGDDPIGTPHLLHETFAPEPGGPAGLAYSTRTGPGAWTTVAIVEDETTQLCDGEPTQSGEICDYDYVRHHPIALVASKNTELRMLWSRVHHLGTRIAACETVANTTQCSWSDGSDATVGELWIGWPVGDAVEAAPLTPSFAIRGRAAIDVGGRIHLALHDRAPNQDDVAVRYMRIAGP